MTARPQPVGCVYVERMQLHARVSSVCVRSLRFDVQQGHECEGFTLNRGRGQEARAVRVLNVIQASGGQLNCMRDGRYAWW
jgi:hypothetical protein